MKTKRLITFAQYTLADGISAAQSVRNRLASALGALDGRDAATLIKLGSDVSRAISALDWRWHMMKIQQKQLDKIVSDEEG